MEGFIWADKFSTFEELYTKINEIYLETDDFDISIIKTSSTSFKMIRYHSNFDAPPDTKLSILSNCFDKNFITLIKNDEIIRYSNNLWGIKPYYLTSQIEINSNSPLITKYSSYKYYFLINNEKVYNNLLFISNNTAQGVSTLYFESPLTEENNKLLCEEILFEAENIDLLNDVQDFYDFNFNLQHNEFFDHYKQNFNNKLYASYSVNLSGNPVTSISGSSLATCASITYTELENQLLNYGCVGMFGYDQQNNQWYFLDTNMDICIDTSNTIIDAWLATHDQENICFPLSNLIKTTKDSITYTNIYGEFVVDYILNDEEYYDSSTLDLKPFDYFNETTNIDLVYKSRLNPHICDWVISNDKLSTIYNTPYPLQVSRAFGSNTYIPEILSDAINFNLHNLEWFVIANKMYGDINSNDNKINKALYVKEDIISISRFKTHITDNTYDSLLVNDNDEYIYSIADKMGNVYFCGHKYALGNENANKKFCILLFNSNSTDMSNLNEPVISYDTIINNDVYFICIKFVVYDKIYLQRVPTTDLSLEYYFIHDFNYLYNLNNKINQNLANNNQAVLDLELPTNANNLSGDSILSFDISFHITNIGNNSAYEKNPIITCDFNDIVGGLENQIREKLTVLGVSDIEAKIVTIIDSMTNPSEGSFIGENFVELNVYNNKAPYEQSIFLLQPLLIGSGTPYTQFTCTGIVVVDQNDPSKRDVTHTLISDNLSTYLDTYGDFNSFFEHYKVFQNLFPVSIQSQVTKCIFPITDVMDNISLPSSTSWNYFWTHNSKDRPFSTNLTNLVQSYDGLDYDINYNHFWDLDSKFAFLYYKTIGSYFNVTNSESELKKLNINYQIKNNTVVGNIFKQDIVPVIYSIQSTSNTLLPRNIQQSYIKDSTSISNITNPTLSILYRHSGYLIPHFINLHTQNLMSGIIEETNTTDIYIHNYYIHKTIYGINNEILSNNTNQLPVYPYNGQYTLYWDAFNIKTPKKYYQFGWNNTRPITNQTTVTQKEDFNIYISLYNSWVQIAGALTHDGSITYTSMNNIDNQIQELYNSFITNVCTNYIQVSNIDYYKTNPKDFELLLLTYLWAMDEKWFFNGYMLNIQKSGYFN